MRLTREERKKLMAGDYGALVREQKPSLEISEKIVLSRSRPRGALVRDPLTGQDIFYPKPPQEDLFWIVVRSVIRHRTGSWRVHFDVFDRREASLLVRRKPPAFVFGQEEEREVPSPEKVSIESAYTTNPQEAVDYLQAVPREDQNVFTVQANARFQEHRRAEDAERREKERARQAAKTIGELAVSIARSGGDSDAFFADIQRLCSAKRDEIRDAA